MKDKNREFRNICLMAIITVETKKNEPVYETQLKTCNKFKKVLKRIHKCKRIGSITIGIIHPEKNSEFIAKEQLKHIENHKSSETVTVLADEPK